MADQPEQFALQLFDSKPEILKKPVQAIHMAITGGVQNRTQRLSWAAMLLHAHDVQAKTPDKTIEVFEISRPLLMSMIDYTSPNRKHLKETLAQMQNLKVQWDILKQDGDSTWASCVLLPFIGFDKDKIYYSYAPQIKPMLFDPKTYARVDLAIQRKLKLDCASALYDWCNRFRNNPSKRTNEMTWEDWRWVIYGAVDANSILNEYKMFKREKLKPAINEINAVSDLEITLIENKNGGRKVHSLQFMVYEKPLFVADNKDEELLSKWDERLEEMGLSLRDRKKILSTHKIEVIEAHYRYTMTRTGDPKQEKLKNVGAYFKNALMNGYAMDLVKKEEKSGINDTAMKEIYEEFRASRNADAINLFNEISQAERDELIEQFNAAQEFDSLKIPAQTAKRVKRVMSPFYSWLATKTWGEPTPQELFEFALNKGKIKLNK